MDLLSQYPPTAFQARGIKSVRDQAIWYWSKSSSILLVVFPVQKLSNDKELILFIERYYNKQ